MKINYLPLLICCLWITSSYGQNLVLNPDFESYYDCPSIEGQFFLDDWETAGGSCDFFHTCASSQSPFFVEVPQNFAGYQWPYSGEGYAGIGCWAFEPGSPDQFNIREYIAAVLTEPLTVGTIYYVSVMVSLSNISSEAINKLGFKFIHEDLLDGPFFDNPIMDNEAHYYTNEIIADTMNWVMLKGSFVADDTYPYMAIGNFFDDVNTDTMYMGEVTEIGNQTAYMAYYYFDDVCVSSVPGFCFPVTTATESLTEMTNITLHPNPAKQSIRFQNIEAVDQIKVLDVTGRVKMEVPAQEQINIEHLAAGIYFIQFKNKKSQSEKTLRFIKQ